MYNKAYNYLQFAAYNPNFPMMMAFEVAHNPAPTLTSQATKQNE